MSKCKNQDADEATLDKFDAITDVDTGGLAPGISSCCLSNVGSVKDAKGAPRGLIPLPGLGSGKLGNCGGDSVL